MADFTQRDVHLVRHEYVLDSPTNATEIGKAVSVALQQMPESMRRYDDSLQIEARDEEIVITWQQEQP